MKGGVIGLINSPTELLEQFDGIVVQDGIEYQHSVVPKQEFTHPELTTPIQHGHAAMEVPEETESVEFSENGITKATTVTKTTKYTNWLLLPGDILVIDNSTGEFLYGLLQRHVGWKVNRAKLDLTSMRSDYSDTEVWQVGFYDHMGTANKGVIYGDHVVDDPDIGTALAESRVNQLGLSYDYGGDSVKITLTESGYVELYQPSSYDAADFMAYFSDEIENYISGFLTE